MRASARGAEPLERRVRGPQLELGALRVAVRVERLRQQQPGASRFVRAISRQIRAERRKVLRRGRAASASATAPSLLRPRPSSSPSGMPRPSRRALAQPLSPRRPPRRRARSPPARAAAGEPEPVTGRIVERAADPAARAASTSPAGEPEEREPRARVGAEGMRVAESLFVASKLPWRQPAVAELVERQPGDVGVEVVGVLDAPVDIPPSASGQPPQLYHLRAVHATGRRKPLIDWRSHQRVAALGPVARPSEVTEVAGGGDDPVVQRPRSCRSQLSADGRDPSPRRAGPCPRRPGPDGRACGLVDEAERHQVPLAGASRSRGAARHAEGPSIVR